MILIGSIFALFGAAFVCLFILMICMRGVKPQARDLFKEGVSLVMLDIPIIGQAYRGYLFAYDAGAFVAGTRIYKAFAWMFLPRVDEEGVELAPLNVEEVPEDNPLDEPLEPPSEASPLMLEAPEASRDPLPNETVTAYIARMKALEKETPLNLPVPEDCVGLSQKAIHYISRFTGIRRDQEIAQQRRIKSMRVSRMAQHAADLEESQHDEKAQERVDSHLNPLSPFSLVKRKLRRASFAADFAEVTASTRPHPLQIVEEPEATRVTLGDSTPVTPLPFDIDEEKESLFISEDDLSEGSTNYESALKGIAQEPGFTSKMDFSFLSARPSLPSKDRVKETAANVVTGVKKGAAMVKMTLEEWVFNLPETHLKFGLGGALALLMGMVALKGSRVNVKAAHRAINNSIFKAKTAQESGIMGASAPPILLEALAILGFVTGNPSVMGVVVNFSNLVEFLHTSPARWMSATYWIATFDAAKHRGKVYQAMILLVLCAFIVQVGLTLKTDWRSLHTHYPKGLKIPSLLPVPEFVPAAVNLPGSNQVQLDNYTDMYEQGDHVPLDAILASTGPQVIPGGGLGYKESALHAFINEAKSGDPQPADPTVISEWWEIISSDVFPDAFLEDLAWLAEATNINVARTIIYNATETSERLFLIGTKDVRVTKLLAALFKHHKIPLRTGGLSNVNLTLGDIWNFEVLRTSRPIHLREVTNLVRLYNSYLGAEKFLGAAFAGPAQIFQNMKAYFPRRRRACSLEAGRKDVDGTVSETLRKLEEDIIHEDNYWYYQELIEEQDREERLLQKDYGKWQKRAERLEDEARNLKDRRDDLIEQGEWLKEHQNKFDSMTDEEMDDYQDRLDHFKMGFDEYEEEWEDIDGRNDQFARDWNNKRYESGLSKSTKKKIQSRLSRTKTLIKESSSSIRRIMDKLTNPPKKRQARLGKKKPLQTKKKANKESSGYKKKPLSTSRPNSSRNTRSNTKGFPSDGSVFTPNVRARTPVIELNVRESVTGQPVFTVSPLPSIELDGSHIGSAFQNSNHFVTAAHVVADYKGMNFMDVTSNDLMGTSVLINDNGLPNKAEVTWVDLERDLAILAHKSGNLSGSCLLSDVPPETGSKIMIPWWDPQDGTLKVSSGTITSVRGNEFCHNASTRPGASGSPVFMFPKGRDGVAKVVGIHTRGRTSTSSWNGASTLLIDEFKSIIPKN